MPEAVVVPEQPTSQPQVRDPERFSGHRVQLRVFEGPLDLLLYLIRAHKYDVCDIPIREITNQFIEFLVLMDEVDLEYAGDFLVTAATLMAIKSRMLLPPQQSQNEDEIESEKGDPRAELVARLLEYQKFQEAAETLQHLREDRLQTFGRIPIARAKPDDDEESAQPLLLLQDLSSFELLHALRRVLERMNERPVATIVRREPFSVNERLRDLVKRFGGGQTTFGFWCDDCQSRLEVVITFLALLELIKRGRVRVQQMTLFDEIEIALL